jgi:prophage DNA circulation protein
LTDLFSIVASVFSVALAIFAIWQANEARRETQANSVHVGEVLKDIESASESIKENVSKNMRDMQANVVETQKGFMEMQKNMTNAYNKRVMADIPQKVSPQDQFVMNLLSEDPDKIASLVKLLQEIQTNPINNETKTKETISDEKK